MGIFEISDSKIHKKNAKAIAEKARKEIDSLEIELKHLETDLKKYQTIKNIWLQIKTR